MGWQQLALEQWSDEHNPIDVDEYRINFPFGKESMLHQETKLEIQYWINKLIRVKPFGAPIAAAEWMYPLNRIRMGRQFCWANEDREFGIDGWLDVNEGWIPTPRTAIDWKYFPKFVFDIAVESGELCDVFEVVCTSPSEPGKRTFCRELGVPFYEIDATKFGPKYGDKKDWYSLSRFYDEPRFSLPLLGGGTLDLQDWARDFKRRYP
jgi:hypothetical protein